MESLARLVAIIFLSIYFVLLAIEIAGFVFVVEKFLPKFGGYWYLLWVPIIIVANWFATLLILILISKFGNKN